jgi:hypothetical protein
LKITTLFCDEHGSHRLHVGLEAAFDAAETSSTGEVMVDVAVDVDLSVTKKRKLSGWSSELVSLQSSGVIQLLASDGTFILCGVCSDVKIIKETSSFSRVNSHPTKITSDIPFGTGKWNRHAATVTHQRKVEAKCDLSKSSVGKITTWMKPVSNIQTYDTMMSSISQRPGSIVLPSPAGCPGVLYISDSVQASAFQQ